MVRFVPALALPLAVALSLAAPAFAQAPTPASSAEDGERTEAIVVEAPRPGPVAPYAQVQDFVLEIGDPPGRRSGYARWEGEVCVGVANLRADSAQYVVDRITSVALDLGLSPGAPGCQPNISIMFTNDGRALAGELVERQRSLFRPYGGAGGTTQGQAALRRFARSDAAVRWWQVSMPVDRMGNPAVATQALGLDSAPAIDSPGNLLQSATYDALVRAIVIVDVSKTGEASWPQLADYIAMIAMGQIDPDAAVDGHDSILGLFDNATPPAELTGWDEAYLHALYSIDLHGVRLVQRAALVEEMAHDHRLADTAD